MKKYTAGLDNGLSGAIAVLEGNKLVAWTPMPVQASRKGNEVDVLALWDWLEPYAPDLESIYYEEPGGAKSYTAAVSMAASFHTVRSVLALLSRQHGFRFVRITPQSWQSSAGSLLNKKDGQDTKALALSMARQLWPQEKWLPTPRCSKPHDGAIDAALIAEWSRTRTVGESGRKPNGRAKKTSKKKPSQGEC